MPRWQVPLCSPPSLTAVPKPCDAGDTRAEPRQQHPQHSPLLPVAAGRAELSLRVPHLTHRWVLVCRDRQRCCLPPFLPALFPVGVLNVRGFE